MSFTKDQGRVNEPTSRQNSESKKKVRNTYRWEGHDHVKNVKNYYISSNCQFQEFRVSESTQHSRTLQFHPSALVSTLLNCTQKEEQWTKEDLERKKNAEENFCFFWVWVTTQRRESKVAEKDSFATFLVFGFRNKRNSTKLEKVLRS